MLGRLGTMLQLEHTSVWGLLGSSSDMHLDVHR